MLHVGHRWPEPTSLTPLLFITLVPAPSSLIAGRFDIVIHANDWTFPTEFTDSRTVGLLPRIRDAMLSGPSSGRSRPNRGPAAGSDRVGDGTRSGDSPGTRLFAVNLNLSAEEFRDWPAEVMSRVHHLPLGFDLTYTGSGGRNRGRGRGAPVVGEQAGSAHMQYRDLCRQAGRVGGFGGGAVDGTSEQRARGRGRGRGGEEGQWVSPIERPNGLKILAPFRSGFDPMRSRLSSEFMPSLSVPNRTMVWRGLGTVVGLVAVWVWVWVSG